MLTPTVYPEFSIDQLDEFLLELEEHDKMISAGVASVGDAANYAEVWEWGNIRQTQPGPKTVEGTNPNGEQVWLSIQAPYGYIQIHDSQYWDILTEELNKIQFKSKTAQGITKELQHASKIAMMRCAVLVANSAPVDRGDLAASFEVIEDGDILLDDDKYSDERVLTLEGGSE